MLSRSQHPMRVQQRLIDDLLDFSRLQEDKMELHPAPVIWLGWWEKRCRTTRRLIPLVSSLWSCLTRIPFSSSPIEIAYSRCWGIT